MARSKFVRIPPALRTRRIPRWKAGSPKRLHRAEQDGCPSWRGKVQTSPAARCSSLARGWAPGRY
eukprot:150117-Alexandrium_andersonii.AAC.1